MYEMGESSLVDAIIGKLDKVRGPNKDGWFRSRCPFGDHPDKNPSFGFTTKGFNCSGCGRKGSLRDLAREIGIPFVEPGWPNARPTGHDAESLLLARGLRSETINHFQIGSNAARGYWTYPVGAVRAVRAKAFDSGAKTKYLWPEGQPATGADVYNMDACADSAEVWLLEGEPDVWIAHQAGLKAVSLTCGGNKSGTPTRRMKAGIAEIAASGVRIVNICMDNDEVGRATAACIARLLRAEGIEARIRRLSDELVPVKGDVTDLYARMGKKDEALREQLADLPVEAVTSDPVETRASDHDSADWAPPIPLRDVKVPTFPADVLPGWMRAMVEQVAHVTQTPRDLGAVFLLAVLSTIWARRIIARINDFWTEPVNLYLVGAAESGARKSAVYRQFVAPVSEFEAHMQAALRQDVNLRRFQRKALEARLQKVQADAAKAETAEDRRALAEDASVLLLEMEEIENAVEPRILADSVTPEKLVSLLGEQGGRMAILEPEGSLFGMLSGRYNRNPDLSAFLKGHTGEDIRTDRIGRGSEVVRSPALTLGLAVQPSVLESLSGNPALRGTGLLARFLYAIPARHVGRRATEWLTGDPAVIDAYNEAVQALLDTSNDLDQQNAIEVVLTPSASSVIKDFVAWIEPQLSEFGELGALADWGSKLAGHAVRIATLLHLSTDPSITAPWRMPIGEEAMRDAVKICKYFIPHSVAAHGLMGQDGLVANAEHVSRWIVMSGASELSARDIYEGVKGRLGRMATVKAAIALLIEHGYLREMEVSPPSGRGRKPSPRYKANPMWLSQNSQNSQKAG